MPVHHYALLNRHIDQRCRCDFSTVDKVFKKEADQKAAVYLHSVGSRHWFPGFFIEERHNACILLAVEQGVLWIDIDHQDKRLCLTAGHCCWLKPGMHTRLTVGGQHNSVIHQLVIKGRVDESFVRSFRFGFGTAYGIDDNATFILLHSACRREHAAAVAEGRPDFLLMPPLEKILTEIANYAHALEAPEALELATTFIRHHLEQPLNLAVIAQAAHMSPRSLQRLFLSSLGTTPARWLAQQRLALAASLLDNTSLSVGEIAERSGYRCQFHFSRAFKKQHARSPLQFRDRRLTEAVLPPASRPV